MKQTLLLYIAIALAVGLIEAKNRDYQMGTVVSMNSVPCGTQQKRHKKTEALLCHEYVLRSGNIDYRIQQKQGKNAELLPIPSVWGHRAGNPAANPRDAAFLKSAVRRWLG